MRRWMIGLLIVFTLAGNASGLEQKGQKRAMKPTWEEQGAGVFRWDTAPKLLVTDGLRRSGADAIAPLQERLRARYGEAVQPQSAAGRLPSQPLILVGLTREHAALRRLAERWKTKLSTEGMGEEGYLLEITPQRILIAAAKPAGAFYGVLRLLERMGSDPKNPADLPAALIADRPAMRWRGMHVMVNGRASMPQIERLLTRHMPELRLNLLILEINYNFQYRSHPEVANEGGLTAEDCRRLSELARRNFVRLAPMINCLGHQSWAETTFKLLTAYPEFDETPDYPKDNKGIYCRSWCPSHPDINRVVFALFDELIDAFQADAFHVGMDEVFILGKCPRCKGKPNADLFAKAVNDYHAHLVGRRKVQMMMWGDRLIDSAVMKYGEWEASANETAPAIDKIAKDIIITDWHYEKMDDYPSVRYFQQKGFRVLPAGWNRAENVRLLTGCALKDATPKMLGYLATTWRGVETVVSGLEGDERALASGKDMPGLMDAIRVGAQIAWEGRQALQ
jgi:hypothetical protein